MCATIELAPMYSTDKFQYSKGRKEFLTEASDLSRYYPFGQLYVDACDLGFRMRSADTGQVTSWYVAEDQTMREPIDGDIMLWKLYPTHETVRKFPQLKDHSLTVLND